MQRISCKKFFESYYKHSNYDWHTTVKIVVDFLHIMYENLTHVKNIDSANNITPTIDYLEINENDKKYIFRIRQSFLFGKSDTFDIIFDVHWETSECESYHIMAFATDKIFRHVSPLLSDEEKAFFVLSNNILGSKLCM